MRCLYCGEATITYILFNQIKYYRCDACLCYVSKEDYDRKLSEALEKCLREI